MLRDPSAHGLRVITGSPGSGKSAILSRLVTLSDPEFRKGLPESERRWLDVIPEGVVDIAIHSKGKTLYEIVDQFATRFDTTSSLESLLEFLRMAAVDG